MKTKMILQLIITVMLGTLAFPSYVNAEDELIETKKILLSINRFKNDYTRHELGSFKSIAGASTIDRLSKKYSKEKILDYLTDNLKPKHKKVFKTVVKYIEVDVGSECYIGIKYEF